jgi:hypothetical protein
MLRDAETTSIAETKTVEEKMPSGTSNGKAENAGDALLVGLTRLRWSRRHRAYWGIIGSYLLRRFVC